jgi:hypothetical protein
MKINESLVRHLNISDLSSLDPVDVYLQDFGPGQGRMIILCYDQPADREVCNKAVLGYCAQGEYCTDDTCRYVA